MCHHVGGFPEITAIFAEVPQTDVWVVPQADVAVVPPPYLADNKDYIDIIDIGDSPFKESA